MKINMQKGSIYENGYGIVAKKVMIDEDLGTTAKALYSLLCTYGDATNNTYAYPSIQYMADKLNIHKDTLYKYLDQLIEKDYIRKHKKKEKGKFARNEYEIIVMPKESPFPNSSDTVSSDTGKAETISTSSISTSYNNTSNNGHHQSAKVQPIIYAKTIADDECYSAIKYYNHRYYMINDKFLALKVNQWQQVKDKFEKVMDKQGLTVDDMKLVIDKYFDTVTSNDYNILHFISGDIIKNQLASLGLAHYSEVN